MSLKSELLINQAALEAYDNRQLSTALTHFAKKAETSKVQWNMGVILASMGRHDEAIARFGESVTMDQYLVVGWYQRGVSYFVSPLISSWGYLIPATEVPMHSMQSARYPTFPREKDDYNLPLQPILPRQDQHPKLRYHKTNRERGQSTSRLLVTIIEPRSTRFTTITDPLHPSLNLIYHTPPSVDHPV